MPQHLRVGIDIGGTFSDVFIFNEHSGELSTAKSWSVTEDPAAVVDIFDTIDVDVRELSVFSHAATVGINSVVTRTGASTGLLCTRGHRDVLDLGSALRAPGEIWDFNVLRPHMVRPLIPREWRRPVTERLLSDGSVLIELDEDEVLQEAGWLVEQGVDSIAIAYINSYVNPAHEQRTAELVRGAFPDLGVFTSTEIFPAFRELPRTTSVAINAYVSPRVDAYIQRMDERLASRDFSGLFTIMKADGGFATAKGLQQRGIETLHSGPVAGVSAARYLGQAIGVENLLIIDMGGTTADVSIVTGGQPPTTNNFEVETDLFVGMPVVDVRSIGAGGGSIAWIDSGGALQVGPASAGSTPGPAAYGRGGTLPTVTDAHVVRGTLSPEHFLGGRAELDIAAAREAIGTVAGPLGLTVEQTADGIIELVEVNMAGALRNMSIYRGHDPRDYALLPVGAAGPMHGAALGRELGVGEVIIPMWPGEFSAFGLLASDYRTESARTVVGMLAELAPERVTALFAEMEEEAYQYLREQGVADDTVTFTRMLDGMYAGQSWDTSCVLPRKESYDTSDIPAAAEAFEAAYELAWGSRLGMPIRTSKLRVVAVGARERPRIATIDTGTATPPDDAQVGGIEATVRIGGALEQTTLPIFDRTRLLAGNVIQGPALIVQQTSTTTLNDGDRATVDAVGNIRITSLETPR